ncbi:MAG: helicase C-terminal domain-containing protein [Candidatus Hodarchaeales archaeon]
MTIRVNREKKEVKLSVKDLSMFASAMYSRRFFSLNSTEFGKEVHKNIQEAKKSEDPNYKTEYYVKYSFSYGSWKVTIRGRVDIFRKESDSIRIEEIKTANLKNFTGEPDDPRISEFKLQVQCYAWMIKNVEADIDHYSLSLIIFNKYDQRQFVINIPYKDVTELVQERIGIILAEDKIRSTLFKTKVDSIEKLHFPFSYRKYQREIVGEISKAVVQGLNLLIEAPSGLGKTVVSIYSILPVVLEKESHLFFLTSKTTQQQIVKKTLDIFSKQGVKFLAVLFRAKEKMCPNDFYFCHEDYCPFLNNYVKNPPYELVQSYIRRGGVIEPSEIEEEAQKTQAFCPFEVLLDISLEADVIVCDYNYVFHPRVSLQRFFSKPIPSKDRYYLIIDEAHNLVNRSRDYYSHNITKKEILKLKKHLIRLRRRYSRIPIPDFLFPVLEGFFRHISQGLSIEVSTHVISFLDTSLLTRVLVQFEESLAEYLHFLLEHDLHWPDDPLLHFYYQFKDFVEVAILSKDSEEFSILYNFHTDEVKVICKDASRFLNQKITNFFKTAIAVSATLTPFFFYRDLLGFPIDKTLYKSYLSPFPPENRKILVIPSIDTRFNQREHYYTEIAGIILNLARIRKGRYFVFFPSFKYANAVTKFLKQGNDFSILEQKSIMQDEDRENFVNSLLRGKNVIAIGVTAGIFSEGVDFPGILDGIFIIGPSLPPYDVEHELLRHYYEEKYGDGFSYAYQFPGLTKTFQAAGRLIRTSSDRGIIVFIGRRFSAPKYANYFPKYYYKYEPHELVTSQPEADVKEFWENLDQ